MPFSRLANSVGIERDSGHSENGFRRYDKVLSRIVINSTKIQLIITVSIIIVVNIEGVIELIT